MSSSLYPLIARLPAGLRQSGPPSSPVLFCSVWFCFGLFPRRFFFIFFFFRRRQRERGTRSYETHRGGAKVAPSVTLRGSASSRSGFFFFFLGNALCERSGEQKASQAFGWWISTQILYNHKKIIVKKNIPKPNSHETLLFPHFSLSKESTLAQ